MSKRTPAPATKSLANSIRLPGKVESLASLSPSPYRLAFRSLPYAAPPHAAFPTTRFQFTHQTPHFSLRCFPSPRYGLPQLPRRPPTRAELSPFPAPALNRTATSTHDLDAGRIMTLEAMHQGMIDHKQDTKPYTMDLTVFCSKKKVHKSAVIRERCKRRLRQVVRLVVTRGIQPELEGKGFDEELDVRKSGPRHWLMPGYHYIANVSLEVYRAPLADLVQDMTQALRALKVKAQDAVLTAELDKIPIPPRDLSPDEPANSSR
ncbi:ribonuclease P protein component [Sporobolomyces koalae]|uniref:ribonuclease P protein component n=1 Tax=Sporobolomyces koalae TaxID=500713 RepID=UPI003173CFD1